MIRSNQTRQISHRRNALRIALCIAMTANTRLAVADSGFETQPQRCSNSSCELPVYPFPTVAEAIADNTQSPSRRAIVRLLGFTSNNKCKPYSGSGLPQVAQPPIAALRPLDQAADLMTPSLPTVTLAVGEDRLAQSLPDLSIQTDSCPDSCTTLSAVQQPMVPVNSAVIAANATRPVQAVQESISDSGKSTQDVVEALDLVNSLDDIVSPPVKPKASHPKATHPKATDFKDSIQVDYSSARDESTEGSGVRLSLSDRDQSATTTKAKAPQLVNTK